MIHKSSLPPEDHNTRAKEMWRIISQEVDFRHKRVVDLGCGTGDFLWRAYEAGADQVVGIDKSEKIGVLPQEYTRMLKPNIKRFGAIGVCAWDLNDFFAITPKDNKNPIYDIAMCFSVIPYLDDPRAFMNWMANSFPISLIEVQYTKEPYNIGKANDSQMAQLLIDCGFNTTTPIGSTYVAIPSRNTWRTIWRCEK